MTDKSSCTGTVWSEAKESLAVARALVAETALLESFKLNLAESIDLRSISWRNRAANVCRKNHTRINFPCFTLYRMPRHSISLVKNPTIHVRKLMPSRRGTSHQLDRVTRSFNPQTPVNQT